MNSTKLHSNAFEITRQHGRSPVNLFHIFRKHFHRDTFGGPLLNCTSKKIKLSQQAEFVLLLLIKKTKFSANVVEISFNN